MVVTTSFLGSELNSCVSSSEGAISTFPESLKQWQKSYKAFWQLTTSAWDNVFKVSSTIPNTFINSFTFLFLVPCLGGFWYHPSIIWCGQQDNPLFLSLQKPFPYSKHFNVVFRTIKLTLLHHICLNYLSQTLGCSLFAVHAVSEETEVCELVVIAIWFTKPVISAC